MGDDEIERRDLLERFGEFERRLDGLLAEVDPAWTMPDRRVGAAGDDPEFTHERINAKRMRLWEVLGSRPERTAELADRILDAITHDDDPTCNKQLLNPLLSAIGRRPVQRHLITVLQAGPEWRQRCAVRAWYWTGVVRVYRRGPELADRAVPGDEPADRLADFSAGCLRAFLATRDERFRDELARKFPLAEHRYPAALRGLVAEARAIAEADPERFARLLATV